MEVMELMEFTIWRLWRSSNVGYTSILASGSAGTTCGPTCNNDLGEKDYYWNQGQDQGLEYVRVMPRVPYYGLNRYWDQLSPGCHN